MPGPISEEVRAKIQSFIATRGRLRACRDHDAHHTNALRVAKLVHADMLSDEMVCCVKTIWNNLFPNLDYKRYTYALAWKPASPALNCLRLAS